MVLKASPRRRLGVRALQVAGRPGHLANLAYGVRLPLLGVRLPLFGVCGTPTTLWQTPCTRREMQRLPPAHSQNRSRAWKRRFPRGTSHLSAAAREESERDCDLAGGWDEKSREAERNDLGSERQAASFSPAHCLRLPPFQPPAHPHPLTLAALRLRLPPFQPPAYPRAARQIRPPLHVSLRLCVSLSPLYAVLAYKTEHGSATALRFVH